MSSKSLRLFAFLAVFGGLQATARADDLEAQILSGNAPTSSAASAPAETPSESSAAPAPAPEEDASKKEAVEEELERLDQDLKGPRSVPLKHILVVQYRFIRKEGTHELTPILVGFQPADSFRRQMVWGMSYAYHLTEDFGLEALHLTFVKNFQTGLSSKIQSETGLFTDRKEPVLSAGSSILWTPLKSKAASIDSISYFEGYFLAGGGFSKFETTTGGLAMAGLGFRSFITQNALFKVEVRDYMDFLGSSPSHRLNVLVGASILLGGDSK